MKTPPRTDQEPRSKRKSESEMSAILLIKNQSKVYRFCKSVELASRGRSSFEMSRIRGE